MKQTKHLMPQFIFECVVMFPSGVLIVILGQELEQESLGIYDKQLCYCSGTEQLWVTTETQIPCRP